MGNYYWYQSLSVEAQKLCMQLLELQKTLLGEKHPDTIRAMAILTFIQNNRRNSNEVRRNEGGIIDPHGLENTDNPLKYTSSSGLPLRKQFKGWKGRIRDKLRS